MKLSNFTFAAVLIVFVAACASAPRQPGNVVGDNYAFTQDYMPRLIEETMRKQKIVGLSIALVDDQDIIWAQGFGYADKANKQPATKDTIYRSGSITKLFTATAVMQLAERGLLDIDEPLQRYLPELAVRSRFDGARPITLRDLMTHHSGLPSDYHNGSWGDDSADFTQLASQLAEEYVATPPNTIQSYSNLGFSLLGAVVERVSGSSYADYIAENILRPAGMRDAYVGKNLNDDPRNSKGFAKNKARATSALRDVPAGGLSTSVMDLAHFAQTIFAEGRHNDQRILDADTLAEMLRAQDTSGTFDLHPSVGLAWRLVDNFGDEAGVLAGHNGGTPMFYSEFLTLPKHKLGVVVLANSETAAGAVHELAREALTLALESKTGIEVEELASYEDTLPVLEADLERIPGFWSSPFGIVEIQRKGSRLKFELDGHKLNLVRREDGFYHLQYKLLGLLNINLGAMANIGFGFREIAGREVLVAYRNGQARAVFAEKATPAPLHALWQQRLGRYESINTRGSLDLKNVELTYENGLLLAKSTLRIGEIQDENSTDVLRPISENDAVVHGLGRGKGETVRFVDDGGEERLQFSGYILRRVN